MSWFKRVFQRRRIYDDLSQELTEHLEERTEQLMRTEGMSRREAEQAAKRAFGNPTLIEEQSREFWQWPRLENLLRDISFSVRLLRKSPGFTTVAILTIALGVGANTAVFSLVNGLLLRPLPVPDAQRLVLLRIQPTQFGHSFCTPLLRALETHHEMLSNIYGFSNRPLQVRGPNGGEEISGVLVSGQYFDALETEAQLGRTLTPADDLKDIGASGFPVVISDSFWKTRYNRAPDILGHTLTIANTAFTIIGVMPRSFVGADASFRPQLFLPLSTEPIIDAPYNDLDAGYHSWWLRVGARLRPGVSLAQANAFLKSVGQPLFREAVPDPNFGFDGVKRDSLSLIAEPGAEGYSSLRFRYRDPLLATFVLCIAVLLLACINLASLLLARGAARKREIATRLAIGATRSRLVQQLLIESLLLAVLGTGAGLATAPSVSSHLVAMLAPTNSNLFLDARLDWRVFLFAACITIGSTLLIGLLPALQATRGDLNRRIKDGASNSGAEHRRLLPKVLLSIEVSIAMVLVTGATLLATSLVRLYRAELGFDPRNLVLANYDMSKQALDGAPLVGLYRTIAERLSAQPGVTSVAFLSQPPISGDILMGSYRTAGGMDHDAYKNIVSPDYFRTMRIPLLAGRDFSWQDTKETGRKIILNQSASKMLFPSGSAVGGQVHSKAGPKEEVYEVTAVVADAKYASLREPAPPTAYIPISQAENHKPAYTAVIRFQGSAMPLAAAIRGITTELAPDVPTPALGSMNQRIDNSIAADRVMVLLSLFFAINALLVMGIGLYGVLTYATARRTSEIGIRMALGAARLQIVGLVLRENASTAGTGCIVGFVTALLAARVLSNFLYGTSPRDPWMLSLSAFVVCLSSAIASIVPAIRAAHINPMEAVRTE